MWKLLSKEKEKWDLEVAVGDRPKCKITLPGCPITDRKAYYKQVKDDYKAGALLHKPGSYFSCGSCRWTTSGEGCLYCNPAKHAANHSTKLAEARQLENAVATAK